MKLSIIGLVFVGFVAALSAAVLALAFRAGSFGGREDRPSEVEIVTATRDLPPMSVVQAESIATSKVPRETAPQGVFSNPVQVIGRVLSLGVTRGQAFTRKHFAAEGSGIHLAATLENGMRAASISLTDYSALYGLLYPGSIVDVLAYLKLPPEGGRQGEAVSVTLLRGVQVLGVEDQTVVSVEKEADTKGPEAARANNRRWMVTLMVRPQEARALQLAMENGRIALAMRNPHDTSPAEEGGMATLSQVARGSLTERAMGLGTEDLFGQHRSQENAARAGGADAAASVVVATSREAGSPTPAMSRQWQMEIFRGGVSETVCFPLPGQEIDAGAVAPPKSEQP